MPEARLPSKQREQTNEEIHRDVDKGLKLASRMSRCSVIDQGVKTRNSGESGYVADRDKPGASTYPPGRPGVSGPRVRVARPALRNRAVSNTLRRWQLVTPGSARRLGDDPRALTVGSNFAANSTKEFLLLASDRRHDFGQAASQATLSSAGFTPHLRRMRTAFDRYAAPSAVQASLPARKPKALCRRPANYFLQGPRANARA